MRSGFIQALVFILTIVSGPGAGFAAQPNMVFILADDCTRWDIGCYGSKDSKTPAINRLAAEGMKFNKCYQAAPMCSPTRHNLYTAMYPTRTGAYPNHTHANDGINCVVQYLKPLGYRVALSGKTHIAPNSIFDFEYSGKNNNPDFAAVDVFIKDAISKNQPFCVFLTSNEPHSPWDKGDPSLFNQAAITLPPHYVDNAETRSAFVRYLAEINYLDGQVQSAVDLLENNTITDNTMVVFASEQGNSFPFAKWTCYSAGLGSALIVKWPGVVPPGTESDALVEYSDVVPTFIDIAGGEPVQGLDGFSLMPVLTQEQDSHKEYTFGLMTTRGINNGSEYFPIRSISNGTYRLIVNLAPEMEFMNAASMPGWENTAQTDQTAADLVQRHKFRPAVELFNDETDPWNMENLAEDPQFADIRQQLTERLEQWMNDAGDLGMETELTAFEHMTRNVTNGDTVVVQLLQQGAIRLTGESPGIAYTFYNGSWSNFPDTTNMVPDGQGVVPDFTSALPGTESNYAVLYEGYLKTDVDGHHTFYLKNTGAAAIRIDGELIVNTSNGESNQRYGTVNLKQGLHSISIQAVIVDAGGLDVAYSYPGLRGAEPKNQIPASALVQGGIVSTSPGAASLDRYQNAAGTIKVYDMAGRLLHTFHSADVQSKLSKIITEGVKPGAGMYTIRIEIQNPREVREEVKVILHD